MSKWGLLTVNHDKKELIMTHGNNVCDIKYMFKFVIYPNGVCQLKNVHADLSPWF